MGNLITSTQGEAACASVDADAAAAAFRNNRGFSALLRNGAGDYSLTLANAQNMATYGNCQVTLQGNVTGLTSVEVVSDTVLRVRTWSCSVGMDADTAAADLDFWIRCMPVPPA